MMQPSRAIPWLFVAWVLLQSCLAGPAAAAAADSVSSVKAERLPALAGDAAPATLVTLGGRPVVIQRGSAHVLKAGGWSPLDRRGLGSDLPIVGGATDGQRAVLLLGENGQSVGRVAVLRLEGDALRAGL